MSPNKTKHCVYGYIYIYIYINDVLSTLTVSYLSCFVGHPVYKPEVWADGYSRELDVSNVKVCCLNTNDDRRIRILKKQNWSLTELKTLEWDILNPDCLIWVSMYTLLIFFLILSVLKLSLIITIQIQCYIDWTNIQSN